MRKTSKYARKKALKAPAPKDLWALKIQGHKPYSEESLFGTLPSIVTARAAIQSIWDAYSRVDNRVSPADTQTDFELLAHAVIVAQIRTYDIGGPNAQEVLTTLNTAVGALDRVKSTWNAEKEWRMSGQDAVLLRDALDIYEQIVLASTPMEMEEAQTTRLDWFKNVYSKGK